MYEGQLTGVCSMTKVVENSIQAVSPVSGTAFDVQQIQCSSSTFVVSLVTNVVLSQV